MRKLSSVSPAFALLLCVLVGLSANQPIHAQGIPVFDTLNYAQIVEMAEHTLKQLQTLKNVYDTTTRMSKGMASLDTYRIPAVPSASHHVERFEYGQPWIQGLETGDARGQGYFATVVPMQRDVSPFNALSPAARTIMERSYATIEILDSVSMMGGHQGAIVRGYHGKLAEMVEMLTRDILNRGEGYNQMTAIADKIAIGQVVARRQDMADNQLISAVLEQRLAQNKRTRDAEAMNTNMILNHLRDGQDPNGLSKAPVVGATDTLRNWSLP